MRGKGKGSDFEREMCRILSKWWTRGKRDDIFWRSSQSGGRATQRMKSGKTTAGSCGDLTALDPIGAPLMDMFTIELKRGNSHGTVWDAFEKDGKQGPTIFQQCMAQAVRSRNHASSQTWMLIIKRDRKPAVVYLPAFVYRELTGRESGARRHPYASFRIDIPPYGELCFCCLLLEDFLQRVTPEKIIDHLDANT